MPITLKCESCGFEQTYPAGGLHKFGQAHSDGWDLPDWSGVTTCPGCPSAPLVVNADMARRLAIVHNGDEELN